MHNKEMFYRMGGWSQMFFLGFFTFCGILIGAVIINMVIVLSGNIGSLESQTLGFMRFSQTVMAVAMFLFPSILFAKLFYPDAESFLKVRTLQSPGFIFLSIVLIVCIQPFIGWISYYNQQVALPDCMAPIEEWMRQTELKSEKVVMQFVADRSVAGIVTNLVVIALLAGLAEEFFFRGCLQQIVNKLVSNKKHLAVWLTAVIFSAIHFQFYGFVPRLLLGALLGYLYIWSGSLWVPVLVHTLHNAMNVILMQATYGTPEFDNAEYLFTGAYSWLAILSFVMSCAVLYFIYKQRVESAVSDSLGAKRVKIDKK